MAINLLAIEPHKVSRDLSGYITYLYGEAKVGKTTLCSQFPKALILAFERGYNALPGVMAQDITRWSEFKEVVRELKKPEVKEAYQSIIVDTLDVAGSLCEKYICNQLGISTIGEGGWTNNGWAKYKKELEETFRAITQLGYALIFISHDKDKTFKRKDGTEYNQIVPTAQTSLNNIAKDMADLYIYARFNEATGKRSLVIRSLDGTIDCGSRFKLIVPETEMSYEALIAALNDAIDKEAKLTEGKYVTDERNITPTDTIEMLDYDKLIEEFNNIVISIMQADPTQKNKITFIVEKYLGQGKKVSESTYAQVELIKLIIDELKDQYKLSLTTENN